MSFVCTQKVQYSLSPWIMCYTITANMWNICENSSVLYQNENISGWKVEKLYVSAFIFRKNYKFTFWLFCFQIAQISFFQKIHISRVIKGISLLSGSGWGGWTWGEKKKPRWIIMNYSATVKIHLVKRRVQRFQVFDRNIFSTLQNLTLDLHEREKKELLPCCIKHRCARQCFQRHSWRKNPPRRRGGAPDAASSHSDRPWVRMNRSWTRDRKRERKGSKKKKRIYVVD